MISRDQIDLLGKYSMFKFTDEEKEILSKKLGESLDRVEIIKNLELDGVEPLYRVYEYSEDFREDKLDMGNSLTREEVLSNTKESEYGYFKLLNIMD